LPSDDTAKILFWALLALGQITMRKIDGWNIRLAVNSDQQPVDHAALPGKLKPSSVAEVVGIEGGVVFGVINLESFDVSASNFKSRHDEHYHEA
jgi:hypothetical protein